MGRVFSVTCVGVPWQLRPDQRKLSRLVVLVAAADQGVAPVIVMPVVPRVDRRRFVTKRDLVTYGCTDECQACAQLAAGMHNAKFFTTTDAEIASASSRRKTMIRDTVSEFGHEQSQRLKSRVGKPERRCVDVQPGPTHQEGGSSGSGSRANKMNTDERESKRAKLAESRGQKRQGEDVEELEAHCGKNNISTLMLRSVPTKLTGWKMSQRMRQAPAPEQLQTEEEVL